MSYVRTTTVVTPASSYDLVTLEDLKSDLAITVDTNDDFLERAIARASAEAAKYCNRVLVAEEVQDVFDLQCGAHPKLMLSRYPVAEISSILQNETELVEGEDFRVDQASGLLYRLGGCWAGCDVTVTYEGGYEDVPLDLQSAITVMVNGLQFNRTRDPLLRSENILSGLYAYTLFDPGSVPSGTAQQVKPMLDGYRAIPI